MAFIWVDVIDLIFLKKALNVQASLSLWFLRLANQKKIKGPKINSPSSNADFKHQSHVVGEQAYCASKLADLKVNRHKVFACKEEHF